MPSYWGDPVRATVSDPGNCPRCSARIDTSGVCPRCALDLRGESGGIIWAASEKVLAAFDELDRAVDGAPVFVPTENAPVAQPVPRPVATEYSAVPPSGAEYATVPHYVSPGFQPAPVAENFPEPYSGYPARGGAVPVQVAPPVRSFTVQSVLAIAGAGLVAVAALVFTFLNPDLTDQGLRSAIIGATALAFAGGSFVLSRSALRVSAEAISGLSILFALLFIGASSILFTDGTTRTIYLAVATTLLALVCFGGAYASRLRVPLAASAISAMAVAPIAVWATLENTALVMTAALVVSILLGSALVRGVPVIAGRFSSPLAFDRALITLNQFAFATLVILMAWFGVAIDNEPTEFAVYLALLVVLAAIAFFSTVGAVPALWSVFGAITLTLLPVFAVGAGLFRASSGPWRSAIEAGFIGVATALTIVVIILLARFVTPAPRAAVGGAVFFGSFIAVWPALGVLTLVLQSMTSMRGESVPDFLVEGYEPPLYLAESVAISVFLTAFALAGFVASWMLRRLPAREEGAALSRRTALIPPRMTDQGAHIITAASVTLLLAAVTSLAITQAIVVPARAAILLGCAATLSLALVLLPQLRTARRTVRYPLIVGAHGWVFVGTVLTWFTTESAAILGLGVLVSIAILAFTTPALARTAYLAVGYAYALATIATALSLTELSYLANLAITATIGMLFAIVITLLRSVKAAYWYAILGVSAFPFLIGVVTVIFDRSGWTALSTGATFALALVMVLTRRPGLHHVIRTIAAALLVPSLAVVIISLGAELFSVSGSPITLPIIAIIVAGVIGFITFVTDALARHTVNQTEATGVRWGIEISAWVTGGIAIILAITRVAAGSDIVFLVCVIMGFGAAAGAIVTKRRVRWIAATALWTFALWAALVIAEIEILEAFVVPPAIALFIVALVHARPGNRWQRLALVAMLWMIVPSVGVIIFTPTADSSLRAPILLAVGILAVVTALALSIWAQQGHQRSTALKQSFIIAAMVAASAGPLYALRISAEAKLGILESYFASVSATVFALATLSAAIAGAAAALWHWHNATPTSTRTRWMFAPALVMLTIPALFVPKPSLAEVAALWVLMALLLATLVVTALTQLKSRSELPPVWFLFVLAWAASVAGWSAREVRVEIFALPLGIAVLAVGIVALRRSLNIPALPAGIASHTLNDWPRGFRGSWALLAPGIILVFLPSTLATGTDPQTWRAILVIGLALAAILLGSLLRFSAPFIIGLIVLPIENIIVFAVQIGRNIGAMPWWITLATAGIVLLAIAVTYERRSSRKQGTTAYLRDLR